jgi:predicted oxidoreductase
MSWDADVIIVGAGLSGLVAAAELVDAGKTVIIIEQEPEQSLGGQAFWSLGGIFLVRAFFVWAESNSPQEDSQKGGVERVFGV